MKFRYLSLYFASIGLKEAILLAFYSCFSIFLSNSKKNIKSYFNNKDIYLFSSARGALSAFLQANNIKDGDSVLLSSFTCLAVPTAVIASGASPIYVDINPLTLNMNLEDLIKQVKANTKAIVVQHTMGRTIDDMNGIIKFASERNILVIEDCALSLGTKNSDVGIGFLGDAAIYSLELSKTLSAGWGGILLNNNSELKEPLEAFYKTLNYESLLTRFRKLIQIITTGIFYNKYLYFFGKYIVALGYKASFFKGSTPYEEYEGRVSSDFVSKLGLTQLLFTNTQFKRLEVISKTNNRNFLYIQESLKNNGFFVLGDISKNHFPVSSRVAFLLKDPKSAFEWFADKGIELGTWFSEPLSTLPLFNFEADKYPNTQFISKHIVNLPCHNKVTIDDLKWLDEIIKTYAEENPNQIYINL